MASDYCSEECKELYPYYGLAPHGHDLSKTGSFVGSTVMTEKSNWPDNFVEDEEGMGVYYCPKCKKGKPE